MEFAEGDLHGTAVTGLIRQIAGVPERLVQAAISNSKPSSPRRFRNCAAVPSLLGDHLFSPLRFPCPLQRFVHGHVPLPE
jgi:hypothetical protein